MLHCLSRLLALSAGSRLSTAHAASGLAEGQVVEYEEVADKGKTSAQNLKVQR
jgi:cold shock CspA family protein